MTGPSGRRSTSSGEPPETRRTAEFHIIRRSTEVQESVKWQPPTGTLGTILEATRRRLPSLDRVASPQYEPGSEPPSLAGALRSDCVAVIAEIKRRSPSKGELNPSI